MVKVYVDERERASKVPKYLASMGVTVIYKQLEIGDYIPGEGYVIERKRVDDLAKSTFEGRLFDQIKRLKSSDKHVILLVEGNINYLRRITSKYKAVEAALITAIVLYEIPTLYTINAQHSAEVIKYIAEKLQKDRDRSPSLPTYRKVSKPKGIDFREWQLYILSSFPGIGPKIAEKLLIKFGSLMDVFKASPAELSRVEGISEEKAWLIHKILTTKYSVKSSTTDLSKYLKSISSDEE
ncbi:MAG: multidrug MFS transporter [Desulfurococcales archaeon ex4484_42]|nr:MAG: multidrug MFS transporter [Desulfurococcales archaeon ex4484_42]